MHLNLGKNSLILLLSVLLSSTAQASTWGVMNFNSGKWGKSPDVYQITLVQPGINSNELQVFFSLSGELNPAPETLASTFTVSCGDISVSSRSSPITLAGLPGGYDYTCTIVASNSAGSSSVSTGVIGRPNKKLIRSSIVLKIIQMQLRQGQEVN